MEIEEKLDKLFDYVHSLQEKIEDEMLDSFRRLSEHHSEMKKINDEILDIEIAYRINRKVKA